AAPAVRKVYDLGLGIGGPVVTDKLWFYSAGRKWGASRYIPGVYFNKSPTFLFYVPDTDRPEYEETFAWDAAARFTWQVKPKHKVTIADNVSHSCSCYYLAAVANTQPLAPEASYDVVNGAGGPQQLPQATWSHPASNRLLFEAGISYG